MSEHWRPLALILLAVAGVYSRVTGAWYCGYDDFFEAHRAAFEDSQHPSRIFTTTHFATPKYRPLSRTLSFLAYTAGNGSPLAYRIRNLVFHLLGVGAVYGLVYALFSSIGVASAAALLFGLHPLMNQIEAAAAFTNTAGNAFLLLSLFAFVEAVRTKAHPIAYLSASLVSAFSSSPRIASLRFTLRCAA